MDENNNLNKTDEQPAKDEIKVDENNNWNGTDEQLPKENPFKSWKFYASFFITIVILAAVSWLFTGGGSDGYWMIGVLLLCVPYIIVGIIAWAIVRNKNRSIALGILLGSIAPFVAVFIGTGGCGLFMF